MSDHELSEDAIETEPPGPPSTAPEHEIPRHTTVPSQPDPYTGEPPASILLRLEGALLGPDGELPRIRRELSEMKGQVNGMANAVERRRQTDVANHDALRTAVRNLGTSVAQLRDEVAKRFDALERRYDERLDGIEARVVRLEERADAMERRLDAFVTPDPTEAAPG